MPRSWRMGAARATSSPSATTGALRSGGGARSRRSRWLAFASPLAHHLGGPVRVVPGGPEQVTKVGIVTGAGGSTLPEARAAGLDALITGEAGHHSAVDAREAGVSLLLGGHYATEVGGVRAVAGLLEDHFGVQCRFVDSPTGF